MSENNTSPSKSPKTSNSAGRGRGRGRGFGLDSSPLRKPASDSSRSSSRPGSGSQSPRSLESQSMSKRQTTSMSTAPKTTVSDSSVPSSSKTVMVLNASAEAFVPKVAKSSPALSVAAPEFIPSEALQNDYEKFTTNLELMLQELMDFPGRFDRSMPNIADYFRTVFTRKEFIETACDVIFEWAITYKNFAYTCGRFCEYIAVNVANDHNGTFKQHILKRCHQEYRQVENLLRSDRNRLCSFAIFLAELYTQSVRGIDPVRAALLDILEKLISTLDDSITITIVQVLKMCGGRFEDDLALAGIDNVARLASILSSINDKIKQGAVNDRNSRMLASISTLRASNWGRATSPAQVQLPPTFPANNYEQEPVFYDRTGQTITREEAGYGAFDAAYPHPEVVDSLEFQVNQWSINDGQYVNSVAEDIPVTGAGDFSEIEDVSVEGVNLHDDADELQDIFVVDDDDEQMTEDMWREFERFEAERNDELLQYHQQHEQ